MKRLMVLLVVMLAITSCSGDTGPIGPPGPIGPIGPPGPGTITVYEGPVPNQGQLFTVSVPEADESNLPLIVVYVQDKFNDWLMLNLVEIEIGAGELAIIRQGEVEILTFLGVEYRIIVITE